MPAEDGSCMEKLLRRIWHLVVRLMEWVFRLLHIRLSEGQWEALKQFVKFGMIGVTNTAVSYCIYLAVLLFLQSRNLFPDTDYLIGNVLSFLLSVLWSFYWNRRFVLRPEEGRILSWPPTSSIPLRPKALGIEGPVISASMMPTLYPFLAS